MNLKEAFLVGTFLVVIVSVARYIDVSYLAPPITFNDVHTVCNYTSSQLNRSSVTCELILNEMSNTISWQLGRQLQSISLALSMIITYIGLLLTNKKRNFRMLFFVIVSFLNIFFNLGVCRFFQTYSYIAQIENELIKSSDLFGTAFKSILPQTMPNYQYFILSENLTIGPWIPVIQNIITIIWEVLAIVILFQGDNDVERTHTYAQFKAILRI